MPLPNRSRDAELARRKPTGMSEFCGYRLAVATPDLRARLVQQRLGRADVGALAHQLRGQAERQLGRQPQSARRNRRHGRRRGRLADVDREPVAQPAPICAPQLRQPGLASAPARAGSARRAMPRRPARTALGDGELPACAASDSARRSICSRSAACRIAVVDDIARQRQARRLQLVALVVDLRPQRFQLAPRAAERSKVYETSTPRLKTLNGTGIRAPPETPNVAGSTRWRTALAWRRPADIGVAPARAFQSPAPATSVRAPGRVSGWLRARGAPGRRGRPTEHDHHSAGMSRSGTSSDALPIASGCGLDGVAVDRRRSGARSPVRPCSPRKPSRSDAERQRAWRLQSSVLR